MDVQIFSALSEPHRLSIVELLYTSPRTVNEIAGLLTLNQPQASKHLKVLANANVVVSQTVKNQRVYMLKPDKFEELDAWLRKFAYIWEERFEKLDKLLRKEVKNGGK